MAWWLSACGGGGGGEPAAPPPVTAIPDSVTVSATAVTEVGDANAFTNSAAGVSGLTFAWNFGDGVTSTEPSPKHSYASGGDFDVTLKVTNSAGTSKDVKFKVAVNNRELVKDLSCAGDAQAGWCWQAPRPSGNSISGTYFLSAQVGWTVGEQGEIQKTGDGGKTWTRQLSGVTKSLRHVRFADANNGWVIGESGTVLRTVDGGAHWSLQGEGFWDDGHDTALTVISPSTAVIQRTDSQFQATTDGGVTWTQRVSPNAIPATVMPDGTMWAANGDGLRKTTDFGKTWAVVKSYSMKGVTPSLVVRGSLLWLMFPSSASLDVLVYVAYRSADGGATWEPLPLSSLPSSGATLVDFVDANVGAIVVNGILYRTVDGGGTWIQVATSAEDPSPDYTVISPGVLRRTFTYTVGEYKVVGQVSENAGATWRSITPPVDANAAWPSPSKALQRLDANTWIVQSDDSFDFRNVSVSTDGMQSWRVVRSSGVAEGVSRNFVGLWFFDAKRGMALTTKGVLLETLSGGRDWSSKLTGLPQSARHINGFPQPLPYTDRLQFIDAKRGWLLAGDSQFHQTQDGGATWQARPSLGSQQILNFQFIDASNGFAVAFRADLTRVLLRTTDGGQTWTQLSELPGAARVLRFSDPLHGVVAGDSGRILSTEDGGKTWILRREGGTSSVVLSVTSSEAGSFWASGSDGLLLTSKDNGATWTQAPVTSTASFYKVRFLDALQGWAVGSGGAVLATKDGGKTWVPQNTGTTDLWLVDVFFADSRSGWIVGRGGTESVVYGTLMVTGTGGQ